MATNHPPSSSSSKHKNADEEDYIDMEVTSSPTSREFEFQMSSMSNDKETTTSPADELFYRGKLLPLHLPPRLEMVHKLLQTSTNESFIVQQQQVKYERFNNIKNLIITEPSTNTSTPFESCNISPSESCRVSCELNPDEYFFEWSTEFSTFINDHPKKYSWSKKLKLIKQSLISQKLKASRTYIKSLFNKSACSDETDQQVSDVKDSSNKYIKVSKKPPFGHIGKCTHPTLASVIKNIEREGIEDNVNSHRRSFSAAIKRHSPTKCLSSSTSSSSGGSCSSSSSFSLNSNGFYDLNFLKRSSSATSEIEGSIEAAIAHCKKSQELCNPRKKLNEAGLNALSISKIAASEIQERSDLCRF